MGDTGEPNAPGVPSDAGVGAKPLPPYGMGDGGIAAIGVSYVPERRPVPQYTVTMQ